MKKTNRLNLRVEAELVARLRRAAEALHKPMSQIVRESVHIALQALDRQPLADANHRPDSHTVPPS